MPPKYHYSIITRAAFNKKLALVTKKTVFRPVVQNGNKMVLKFLGGALEKLGIFKCDRQVALLGYLFKGLNGLQPI